MSRLNGKHLARVNQQLSGQPRQAPDGCAQPKGVGMRCFPLSLRKTQLPWSVNQALACHTLSKLCWQRHFCRPQQEAASSFLTALMGCWKETGKKGEPTSLPQGRADFSCLFGLHFQPFSFPNGRGWGGC